jgi:AraC family transcriptional regulator, alkane utilization regulator
MWVDRHSDVLARSAIDALSGVLKSVRLDGALYIDAEFTAPWCLRGRYGIASVRQRLAGAEHVVFFHYLAEGTCKVKLVDDGGVMQVHAGDLVLFPRDDRHLMGSDLQIAPLETESLNGDSEPAAGLMQMRHGGGGAATRLVCGYLACNRDLCRPVFDALPRVLRIPIGDGQASALLRELLRAGVHESQTAQPGGDSTLAKLAELMLVEALRRYAASLPPDGKGWLAAARDPQVGRALALMHHDSGKPWTVEELAREVAMSRSALAERFTSLVGEPPMQYLTRWRLALAARTLRGGNDALSRVAERSGYVSEAAFNRAFKREFGMPPAAWRRAGAA